MVKISNDHEMAPSERISHGRNRAGKKLHRQTDTYTCTNKTNRKPNEQLFPNRRPPTFTGSKICENVYVNIALKQMSDTE